MTLVSVKGAGFKTSTDQPVSMEEVLNGILYGKTLPYKYMPLSLDKGIVYGNFDYVGVMKMRLKWIGNKNKTIWIKL